MFYTKKYLSEFDGLETWKQTLFGTLEKNKIQAQASWDMTHVSGRDTLRFLATLTVGKYTETVVVEFIADCFAKHYWIETWQTEVEKALDRIGRKILQDYANENKSRSNT